MSGIGGNPDGNHLLVLSFIDDRGAISFRNVGTKSTPHPAEIVPKRDAHHILTPGYVKIILWLEYSL
jgi:hypothetical protein